MKVTKYQHACLVIEKDGASLVIDPGAFSHDFILPKHVAGIVITHEHPDHFDAKLVQHILDANPKAAVIAHSSISGQFTNNTAIAAEPGENYQVGPFSLRFFGGEHATIASTIPTPPNLGVLVDTRLYYPGDSFVAPKDVQVEALALPISAPWLKISESIDFLSQVKPRFAFPTHDAILSEDGKVLIDRMVGAAAAAGQHTLYKRLDGQAVELP